MADGIHSGLFVPTPDTVMAGGISVTVDCLICLR